MPKPATLVTLLAIPASSLVTRRTAHLTICAGQRADVLSVSCPAETVKFSQCNSLPLAHLVLHSEVSPIASIPHVRRPGPPHEKG